MQAWWRRAVTYQVYPRSFVDADGDGVGDIAGIRSRLPYLADLGVDAIWINPWYPSPMADAGYDVSDYRDIEPVFGDLAEADAMISEAHRWGLKVILDIVPNHTSDHHRFFQEALAGAPGSAARARYYFRPGKGENGELPPNDWRSTFGGPAWTRTTNADGSPGEWYLHLFTPGQPDVDWTNSDVRAEFEDVLRFWFDRGVDGFRIDVAHGLFTAEGLSDVPVREDGVPVHNEAMWDQPEVHEVYRSWRTIGDAHPGGPKYFIGEIWVLGLERLRPYVAPGRLHQAFNFDLLVQPWDAARLREAIDAGVEQALAVGRPTAWVLNNHDVHRAVTRYGQEQDRSPVDPTDMIAAARRQGPVDVAVGSRRARAAAMLLLALPGTAYLYQGEELGLPEVLDLPDSSRQDPIWVRSGGREPGRDGCRVPMPWASDAPAFGFSRVPGASRALVPAEPWLPQPEWFASYAVDRQEGRAGSFLSLYRSLLASRRRVFAGTEPLRWLDLGSDDILAFARGHGVCVVNLGSAPVHVPEGLADAVVAVSEGELAEGRLAGDHAIWLDTSQVPGVSITSGWRLVPALAGNPHNDGA